jgi:hypothetical protein
MKKISIVLLVFTFTFSQAQVLTYEQVSTSQKRASSKNIKEYVAQNGEVFKVGEMITLAQPMNANNAYLYIIETDGFSSSNPANISSIGYKSEIKKFRVDGTKRQGFQVTAICKTEIGVYNYWIQIEKAIIGGEIETSVLTREQAIAKLKESKDLLDLEMMTQEEYDKIKTELTPIIKGNKK